MNREDEEWRCPSTHPYRAWAQCEFEKNHGAYGFSCWNGREGKNWQRKDGVDLRPEEPCPTEPGQPITVHRYVWLCYEQGMMVTYQEMASEQWKASQDWGPLKRLFDYPVQWLYAQAREIHRRNFQFRELTDAKTEAELAEETTTTTHVTDGVGRENVK